MLKETLDKLNQTARDSVLSSEWLREQEAKPEYCEVALLIARVGDLVRSLREVIGISIEAWEELDASSPGAILAKKSDRLKLLIEIAYLYSHLLLEVMAMTASALTIGKKEIRKFAVLRVKLRSGSEFNDLFDRLTQLQGHVDLFRNKMVTHREPAVILDPCLSWVDQIKDISVLAISMEDHSALSRDYDNLCQKLRQAASGKAKSELTFLVDLIEREPSSYYKASQLNRYLSWIPQSCRSLKNEAVKILGRSGVESKTLSSILEAIVTAFSDFMTSFNEQLKLIYQPVNFSRLEKELLMELEQLEKGNGKRPKRED